MECNYWSILWVSNYMYFSLDVIAYIITHIDADLAYSTLLV